MSARTHDCDEATMRGRLRKAEDFMTAAGIIDDHADKASDMADAFVTLCVHAGIAAADAICCRELGKHAQGESHNEAVSLLARVRPDGNELAKGLRTLLAMKTKAGYSSRPVSSDERKRAARQAEGCSPPPASGNAISPHRLLAPVCVTQAPT